MVTVRTTTQKLRSWNCKFWAGLWYLLKCSGLRKKKKLAGDWSANCWTLKLHSELEILVGAFCQWWAFEFYVSHLDFWVRNILFKPQFWELVPCLTPLFSIHPWCSWKRLKLCFNFAKIDFWTKWGNHLCHKAWIFLFLEAPFHDVLIPPPDCI